MSTNPQMPVKTKRISIIMAMSYVAYIFAGLWAAQVLMAMSMGSLIPKWHQIAIPLLPSLVVALMATFGQFAAKKGWGKRAALAAVLSLALLPGFYGYAAIKSMTHLSDTMAKVHNVSTNQRTQ